jgi:hypothetical protein
MKTFREYCENRQLEAQSSFWGPQRPPQPPKYWTDDLKMGSKNQHELEMMATRLAKGADASLLMNVLDRASKGDTSGYYDSWGLYGWSPLDLKNLYIRLSSIDPKGFYQGYQDEIEKLGAKIASQGR